MAVVVSEIFIDCLSAPRLLWGAIADTERLNRAMGLSKLSVTPIADSSAARFLVKSRIGGFALEYEERPFEWVYPEMFRILRKMRAGPSTELETSFQLSPKPDGGTAVTVRLSAVPRVAFLGFFIKIVMRRSLRDMARAIRGFDAELHAGGGVHPLPPRGAVHLDALDRASTALCASAPRELAQRLVRFVREGDDADVQRIRPFALADAWSVDRYELLSACLTAVRAGLLELTWAVICPSCRGATQQVPTLDALGEHGACTLCEIDFDLDLDEALEAMFAPSPAIRAVDLGAYCTGGPAKAPHVFAQAILPPRADGYLVCPAEEGPYRIFIRGGAMRPLRILKGAPTEVRADDGAAASSAPLVAAPSARIAVENASDLERHAKIERPSFAEQAAKARIVLTMPGFRRDFSKDILRPDMALKVARVGLFFSDLTGSTQLYSDAGDAAAFKLVQDHFEVVIREIEKGHGTLVKTIGDAVMAAFTDDLDGLLAAIRILHAFEEFRRRNADHGRTNIKLGVYGGPCYAVTANSALDYFGQTVNIAARLQGEAKSGELVVTSELADRAIVAKAIPEAFVSERYEARLKGVHSPIHAARLRIAPG